MNDVGRLLVATASLVTAPIPTYPGWATRLTAKYTAMADVGTVKDVMAIGGAQMTTYKRPPIIEAVIDVGFDSEFTVRDLERARDKLARSYPHVGDRMDIAVKIESGKVLPTMSLGGFQMNAENGLDLLILQKSNLATSRLAPYESWEALVSTAAKNYATLVSTIGRQQVKRISARFINRVDIPNEQVLGEDLDVFFSAGALIPKHSVRDFSAFSMQANVIESETGLPVSLNMSTAPPALLAHQSFMIDIDVSMTQDIPLRTEDMWSSTDRIRAAKNNLFEACLTERTRDLFK